MSRSLFRKEYEFACQLLFLNMLSYSVVLKVIFHVIYNAIDFRLKKTMINNEEQLDKFKPASDNFEFQQFPFYWLTRVGSAYSLRMEKALKKGGINITAWRILMILREMGTLSVSNIATHALAKTPTITRATYRLQTEGHVVISTSEKDGRVSMVELTPVGEKTINEVIEQSKRVFENIYTDLSAEQIEVMNTTLQKLFVNLSEF